MKTQLLAIALCCFSLNGFAQFDWGGGGGFDFGGGGFDFGGGGFDFGGGGGINFGGDGSGNSGNIADYQSKKDIDYVGDNHIGHKMDVYFPKEDGQKHNVIIHIYGSAWGSNNSKGSADLGTVGVAALQAGYIFVTPNHRTYNDALYPAQINDIKAVVRYLRGNAEELGIDTSFIGISGFSSGGHLASLMGVTRGDQKVFRSGSESMDLEGNLGNYTNESSWVDAVCDWSGPVDCRYKGCGSPIQMAPENDMVGGCNDQQCPDKHALLGANTFITENSAPTMVCHGSSDNIVPQCEGKMFYDNLQKAGVESVYYPHEGGHGVAGEYTGKMIEFFQGVREKKAANRTEVASVFASKQDICLDYNRIYLCNEESGEAQFTLTDLSGKNLMEGKLDSDGIDISNLSSGIYFIRTVNKEKSQLIKFVK